MTPPIGMLIAWFVGCVMSRFGIELSAQFSQVVGGVMTPPYEDERSFLCVK